jgi:cytochrome c-type biogenesis protein CcmF
MMVAHLGVAVFIFGVTMVNTYEVERDVKMARRHHQVAGYTFTFKWPAGSHRAPTTSPCKGLVEVTRDGQASVTTMQPEKRIYRVQRNPMTEAAIDTGFTRDLYVSLGEQVEGGAWIVRVYYKPFVDWIWGGCLLMALGGLLAATDRRYRVRARSRMAAARQAAAGRPQGGLNDARDEKPEVPDPAGAVRGAGAVSWAPA